MSKKIFILAGELSGDQYAGMLISALKRLDNSVDIYAMGGSYSYRAGANIILDPTNMAVVGIWEVLKHLREFKYMFRTIKEHILNIKPDVIVFIDYPGFNLRLAKELRGILSNTKFVYYISPQLWAWGRSRVKLMKALMDKVIVIFPFEVDFYRQYGVDASFFGHPLGALLKRQKLRADFRDSYSIDLDKPLIVLMPGSRIQEVKAHLPVFIRSAERIHSDFCFCINKAQTVPDYIYKDYLIDSKIHIPLIERDDHGCSLNEAKLVWVASGTATLESTFYKKPMIVVYKVSALTYFLLKPFVKVDYISIVNILSGKRLVPELIQADFTEDRLLKETFDVLSLDRYDYVVKELEKISDCLFSKDPNPEIAREILK